MADEPADNAADVRQRITGLMVRASRERADADTWYGKYEQLIAHYPTGAFPGNITPAGVTIAYQRASHHRQAWAASCAEALALMELAKLAGHG